MHERAGRPLPEELASEAPEIPAGWEPVYDDFRRLDRSRRMASGMAVSPLPITEAEMDDHMTRQGYEADEADELRFTWRQLDGVVLQDFAKRIERETKK
jgi:hypothetical protein